MTAPLLCCISSLQEKLKFNNFKGNYMHGLTIFLSFVAVQLERKAFWFSFLRAITTSPTPRDMH